MPEHPLGVRAGALEVEGERRQAAQDDPDPGSLTLHAPERCQKRRERVLLPPPIVGQQMRLVIEEQRSGTIRIADGAIELGQRVAKHFGWLRRLRLVGRLDADLADHHAPRPEEPQPALDGLADSRQRVATTD